MSGEKISEMPSAGALTGSEVVPVVRPGQNYSTTTGAIAALAAGGSGIPIVYLDASAGALTYTLSAIHTPVTLVDNEGVSSTNHITVQGAAGELINGAAVFPAPPSIWQDYASYTFQWNGTQWRVF
jgi:hypothetical protein